MKLPVGQRFVEPKIFDPPERILAEFTREIDPRAIQRYVHTNGEGIYFISLTYDLKNMKFFNALKPRSLSHFQEVVFQREYNFLENLLMKFVFFSILTLLLLKSKIGRDFSLQQTRLKMFFFQFIFFKVFSV